MEQEPDQALRHVCARSLTDVIRDYLLLYELQFVSLMEINLGPVAGLLFISVHRLLKFRGTVLSRYKAGTHDQV